LDGVDQPQKLHNVHLQLIRRFVELVDPIDKVDPPRLQRRLELPVQRARNHVERVVRIRVKAADLKHWFGFWFGLAGFTLSPKYKSWFGISRNIFSENSSQIPSHFKFKTSFWKFWIFQIFQLLLKEEAAASRFIACS